MSCITLGFSLWRLLNGDWLTTVGLWLLAIGGGIIVMGAYWIDDLSIRLRKADKGEQVIHDRIQKP